MKFVAIYVRVSTDRQTHRSQLADLERFAASQTEPVRWYRDNATGKTTDRPGWNALSEAVEARQVSRIVCWRLDRLGRRTRDLAALFATLNERGVGLVSMKEGLDLATPAGKLMAHLLASVAEFELEVRSERQRAGIAAARKQGVTWGGREEGSRNTKTESKTDAVAKLAGSGLSQRAISKATGLSRQTVRSLLSA